MCLSFSKASDIKKKMLIQICLNIYIKKMLLVYQIFLDLKILFATQPSQFGMRRQKQQITVGFEMR